MSDYIEHYLERICSHVSELERIGAHVADIRGDIARAVELTDWASMPHAYMRPRVYRDGEAWCALYGDNIMEGVCGFGETPAEACREFDFAWCLAERKRQQGEA